MNVDSEIIIPDLHSTVAEGTQLSDVVERHGVCRLGLVRLRRKRAEDRVSDASLAVILVQASGG